jgi:MFS family permease
VIVAGMTTQEFSYEAGPVSARAVRERSRWMPLPIVLAGTFMVVLDYFIVNVALPSIQSQLKANDGSLEWVVAGFACTSAIFVITAARLGDRFGRRRMFSLGLALFTLASAACGAAATPLELVIARLIQSESPHCSWLRGSSPSLASPTRRGWTRAAPRLPLPR